MACRIQLGESSRVNALVTVCGQVRGPVQEFRVRSRKLIYTIGPLQIAWLLVLRKLQHFSQDTPRPVGTRLPTSATPHFLRRANSFCEHEGYDKDPFSDTHGTTKPVQNLCEHLSLKSLRALTL